MKTRVNKSIYFLLIVYLQVSALWLIDCPSKAETISFGVNDILEKSAIDRWNGTSPLYFHMMMENGMSPLTFTADPGTHFNVGLMQDLPQTFEAVKDMRSLTISILPQAYDDVKDKIFLNALPHWSSNAFQVDGGVEIISFMMKLDRKYEIPEKWTVHLQVWECCGGHPPFAMSVSPSSDKHSDPELFFSYRDDAAEHEAGGPERIIYKTPFMRDRWANFTLLLAPSPDDSVKGGSIGLWMNGKEEFCIHPHWGYSPRMATLNKLVNGHMGIDLGIYRVRQNSFQSIYLSQIIYKHGISDVGSISAGDIRGCFNSSAATP